MKTYRSKIQCSIPALAVVLCIAPALFAQANPQTQRSKSNPSPSASLSDSDAASLTAATLKEAGDHPTPKAADGHPDLMGYWAPVIGQFGFEGKPFITSDRESLRPLFTNGGGVASAKAYYEARANYDKTTDSRPAYKPEFREKAKENFLKSDGLDPAYKCQPLGVPRLGAPNEIFQSPDAVALIYENPYDMFQHFTYRIVPTDGRKHDPDADPMALGDSIGRWEGDTLVVDVTKLSPNTWLNRNGSFHDGNLHVVERLSRKGNTLIYSVTMDDPTMWERPFEPKPVTLILKPGQHSHEDYPCAESDQEHVVYDDNK